MAIHDPAQDIRDNPIPRRILSLVEAITAHDPSILVRSVNIPSKSEFDCLEFKVPSKNVWSSSSIELLRVEKTIERWCIILMEEANMIQRAALSLHTISRVTPLTQKTVYELKYASALDYVQRVTEWQTTNQTTDYPSTSQVSVPSMIKSEADVTGDPYFGLAYMIVLNWEDSQNTLKEFFGYIEGERRAAKARVKACTTVAELEAVAWANWPYYNGNPPTATE